MVPAAIPEIKKILYTTDLSENARYAFGYAMSLANRYGAGITILHVLDDSPSADSLVINMIGQERFNKFKEESEQKVMDTIRERLKNFCEEVTREVPECPFITDEILVKAGNPAEEILGQVATGQFDMVVMGAHGQGIVGAAVMGSVSRRVGRRSKTPVLVIRLPEEG